MTDSPGTAPTPPDPDREAALDSLERLVGTWDVSGPGLRGQVRFHWLNRRRSFLVQEVDLDQDGEGAQGVEYIGYDPQARQLRSHYFGTEDRPLEYTWQVADDTLTIWFGDPSSPARYVGTFSAGGTTNAGAWEWPGGGYRSTMTRSAS